MNNHVVNHNEKALNVLNQLNSLTDLMTLLVADDNEKVIGTISDGDIRRGIINGHSIDQKISLFINKKFNYLEIDNFDFRDIKRLRNLEYNLIPILNKDKTLNNIIILKEKKNILPVSAIIMAGGLGKRLYPLTKTCPKPLLKIKEKRVIDYTTDLLFKYGIKDLNFCLHYNHEKFLKYFDSISNRDINIKYVIEEKRMGTIGGISLFDDFLNEDVIIINADIITSIDLENFYEFFLDNNSDLSVATRNYSQNVPFAVVEEANNLVTSIKEKPEFTFKTNSGIYLTKKRLLNNIPKDSFYDATDFIDNLIKSKNIVSSYNFHDKWIDIGSHKDLKLFQDGNF
jgi:dTDP-glucose pyrophosphorylase